MLGIPLFHVLHWFKYERKREKRYEVDTSATNQRSIDKNAHKTEINLADLAYHTACWQTFSGDRCFSLGKENNNMGHMKKLCKAKEKI